MLHTKFQLNQTGLREEDFFRFSQNAPLGPQKGAAAPFVQLKVY